MSIVLLLQIMERGVVDLYQGVGGGQEVGIVL